MDKFIPKAKLSKKAKHERAKAQRETWGSINPVTRKPPNPKAYVREKPRIDGDDDTGASLLMRNEELGMRSSFRIRQPFRHPDTQSVEVSSLCRVGQDASSLRSSA